MLIQENKDIVKKADDFGCIFIQDYRDQSMTVVEKEKGKELFVIDPKEFDVDFSYMSLGDLIDFTEDEFGEVLDQELDRGLDLIF